MAGGIVLLLAVLLSFISALIVLSFLSVGVWISSIPFMLATVWGIYVIYRQWSKAELEKAEPVDVVERIRRIQEKSAQAKIDQIAKKKGEAEDE